MSLGLCMSELSWLGWFSGNQQLSGNSLVVQSCDLDEVLHSTCYANQVYNDARIVTIRIL